MRLLIPKQYAGVLTRERLLQKAREVVDLPLQEFRFMAEYQEAVYAYVADVLRSIMDGVARKFGVDPATIRKASVSIPAMTLVKAMEQSASEMEPMVKALLGDLPFSGRDLKAIYSKFGIMGKGSVKPLRIAGKSLKNPKTGKLLTGAEWKQIENSIVAHYREHLDGIEDEIALRSSLLALLRQSMGAEKVPVETQQVMGWDDLQGRYGKAKFPRSIKAAKEYHDFDPVMVEATKYAAKHAGEFLSVKDGKLKQRIVASVKNIVEGSIEDGVDAGQLAARLYRQDPDDVLGNKYRDNLDTMDRDWRRVAITETSSAINNGFLAAVIQDADGEPAYVVYTGRPYAPEGSGGCNQFIGNVYRLVGGPTRGQKMDDRIGIEGDDYASGVVWPGKNNVGRKASDWWACIPTHPHCRHWWEEIYPDTERYDRKTMKVLPTVATKSFEKSKRKRNPEADRESEKIRESSKVWGMKRHKFIPAKWTHSNGHPRCEKCGMSESVSGVCEPKEFADAHPLRKAVVDLLHTHPGLMTVGAPSRNPKFPSKQATEVGKVYWTKPVRQGLVSKRVTVQGPTRTYQAVRWVSPFEETAGVEKPKAVEPEREYISPTSYRPDLPVGWAVYKNSKLKRPSGWVVGKDTIRSGRVLVRNAKGLTASWMIHQFKQTRPPTEKEQKAQESWKKFIEGMLFLNTSSEPEAEVETRATKLLGMVKAAIPDLDKVASDGGVTVHVHSLSPQFTGNRASYHPPEKTLLVWTQASEALPHEVGHMLDHLKKITGVVEVDKVSNQLVEELYGGPSELRANRIALTLLSALSPRQDVDAAFKAYEAQDRLPEGMSLKEFQAKALSRLQVSDRWKAFEKVLREKTHLYDHLVADEKHIGWGAYNGYIANPAEVLARLTAQYVFWKVGPGAPDGKQDAGSVTEYNNLCRNDSPVLQEVAKRTRTSMVAPWTHLPHEEFQAIIPDLKKLFEDSGITMKSMMRLVLRLQKSKRVYIPASAEHKAYWRMDPRGKRTTTKFFQGTGFISKEGELIPTPVGKEHYQAERYLKPEVTSSAVRIRTEYKDPSKPGYHTPSQVKGMALTVRKGTVMTLEQVRKVLDLFQKHGKEYLVVEALEGNVHGAGLSFNLKEPEHMEMFFNWLKDNAGITVKSSEVAMTMEKSDETGSVHEA